MTIISLKLWHFSIFFTSLRRFLGTSECTSEENLASALAGEAVQMAMARNWLAAPWLERRCLTEKLGLKAWKPASWNRCLLKKWDWKYPAEDRPCFIHIFRTQISLDSEDWQSWQDAGGFMADLFFFGAWESLMIVKWVKSWYHAVYFIHFHNHVLKLILFWVASHCRILNKSLKLVPASFKASTLMRPRYGYSWVQFWLVRSALVYVKYDMIFMDSHDSPAPGKI